MVLIAVLERVPDLHQPPLDVNPPTPDPAPPGNEPNPHPPGTGDPEPPAPFPAPGQDPQPPDVTPGPDHPRPIDRAGAHDASATRTRAPRTRAQSRQP